MKGREGIGRDRKGWEGMGKEGKERREKYEAALISSEKSARKE